MSPNPSGVVTPDLGSTPNHEKPAVYREGDQWVFRAYAVGSCNLKLALIASGKAEQFSAKVLKAFEDGHEYEAIVKDRLRRYGVVIDGEQYEMNWPILPGFAILRGHSDGFAPEGFPALPSYGLPEANPLPGIIEIKSANEDGFDDFLARGLDAFEGYRWQADAYCLEARERLGRDDVGVYFVVNCKADVAKMHVIWYPGPEKTLADYQAKAVQVVSLHSRLAGGEHVECVDWEGQKFGCYFADGYHGRPLDKTESVLEDATVYKLASQERELGGLIDELTQKRKDLKAVLQLKHREMLTDRVVVRDGKSDEAFVLYRQKSPPSIDRKAMRRDHPELIAIEEQYTNSNNDHLRIGVQKPPKPKAPKAKRRETDADEIFEQIRVAGGG